MKQGAAPVPLEGLELDPGLDSLEALDVDLRPLEIEGRVRLVHRLERIGEKGSGGGVGG